MAMSATWKEGRQVSSDARSGSSGRGDQETGAVERELWCRLKQQGDREARDALITRFLPLARGLAKRHQTTGVPFEDLIQVANVGLIAAVDRFEPERNLAFATFAVPVIRGELKRELDRSGWAVRTPRQLRQLMQRMRRSKEALTGRLGRAPTAEELAAHGDLSVEEVREAHQVELALLSQTQYLGRRSSGRTRDEVDRGVDERFGRVEDVSTIARAYATLSPRERKVLRLSVVEELPQHEIAIELGVSQRQVSRILRQALERMHRVARKSTTSGRLDMDGSSASL
jgi:RNA polymerase sigma-B factor